MRRIDALLTSPWILPYGAIDRTVAERIRPIAEERSFKAGMVLFEQGESVPGLFYLLSGSVKQSAISANGNLRSLFLVGAGCVVGETSAFDGEPSQLETIAVTDVRVLFLSREHVHQLITADPSFARVLLYSVTRKLRAAVKVVSDSTLRPVPEQLACLLHQLARQKGPDQVGCRQVSIAISHQELAELLGVSRVTISQCLAHLRERGLIETGHRVLYVLNPARLRNCGAVPYCIVHGESED